MNYRMILVCLYPSILIAGCGSSKERPDVRIEATLYMENREQNGQKDAQLSYDFDDYHPNDHNQYSRDETKHTFSAYASSLIKLGPATIKEQAANIVYYVYLNDSVFRDAAENAQIKIDAEPKKFYVDKQGHYALLCAKTTCPDKK